MTRNANILEVSPLLTIRLPSGLVNKLPLDKLLEEPEQEVQQVKGITADSLTFNDNPLAGPIELSRLLSENSQFVLSKCAEKGEQEMKRVQR